MKKMEKKIKINSLKENFLTRKSMLENLVVVSYLEDKKAKRI
jgi:hypothetical protein